MFQNPNLFKYEKKFDKFYSNLEVKYIKVWKMLYVILIELIGDPVQYDEFVQLWNFILLSHPAHDNYLEYSLVDYNTWISLGLKIFKFVFNF